MTVEEALLFAAFSASKDVKTEKSKPKKKAKTHRKAGNRKKRIN